MIIKIIIIIIKIIIMIIDNLLFIIKFMIKGYVSQRVLCKGIFDLYEITIFLIIIKFFFKIKY